MKKMGAAIAAGMIAITLSGCSTGSGEPSTTPEPSTPGEVVALYEAAGYGCPSHENKRVLNSGQTTTECGSDVLRTYDNTEARDDDLKGIQEGLDALNKLSSIPAPVEVAYGDLWSVRSDNAKDIADKTGAKYIKYTAH